jgi:PAS domain S-box-containing protein
VRASYRPRRDEAGKVQGVYAMVVDETELKLAEEQLAERDQRHRATFEGASVGIAQVSTDGRILDLNDAACGIFGYTREELLSMGVGEVSHPDDLTKDLAMAGRVLSGEIGRYRMEKRLLRKGGTVAWVDLGVSLVRDAAGHPLYFVSTFEDVTARKAAEEALRASEAKWRFLATLSDALRGADSLERVAGEACRLLAEELGVERCTYTSVDLESNQGNTIAEFRRGVPSVLGIHRVSDYGLGVWERSARGETVANRDVREDPSTKESAAAYEAIGTRAFVHAPLLRDGRLLGFLDAHATEPRDWSEQEIETVRDVASRLWEAAQRSSAEEALRGSESRLRLALETAQLGTWDHEVATGITHYSETVGPMLGRAREPISLSPEELLPYVHPDDRALVAEAIRANLERGETYFARMRVIGEDGVVRWVESRGDLERDAEGQPQRVRGVAVDVTEQVEAERALRESNERLEQAVGERTEELVRANRDLDQFAYSVAHDLRAPLRNVVSTSRILLEDAGDRLRSEEADLLRRQAASALRLAKIVDDLLGFARLADAEPKKEPFDMSALAKKTAAEVLARRGGCVVEVREGMRAVGDPSLIGYVLTNMLDNACKFSPGEAVVSVGEEGGAFFVRDRGQGFNMAHVGKLFVAFERLVGQEVEGTGVGLANVRRIVEKHGGRVWAESEGEGKGATFWFTLG